MSASRASTWINSEPTLASVATPVGTGGPRKCQGRSHPCPQALAGPCTCGVLSLGEARRLVVDVLQHDAHLLQGEVSQQVEGWGGSSGRGPAAIAGRFDDEGEDGFLFPIQVSEHQQAPVRLQVEVLVLITSCGWTGHRISGKGTQSPLQTQGRWGAASIDPPPAMK